MPAAAFGASVAGPVYFSIKAVASSDKADDTKWLMYWVLWAALSVVEALIGSIFNTLFVYAYVKVAVWLWLWLPSTDGASLVYSMFLRPQLHRHAPALNALLRRDGRSATAKYPETVGQGMESARRNMDGAGQASH